VRSTLASGRARRILVAYTINRLGTWFGFVALAVAVYDHTGSALAVAGLLLAGQALPAFVVPYIVARVEASPRRGELSGLYFIEAVAAASLAVMLWNFSLPVVLVLVAVDGAAALAASALLRSELAKAAREQSALAGAQGEEAQTLADEAERNANAALNVAFSATFVAGPAVGGVLVAAFGASTALILDAVTFLICGMLLLDLHPNVEDAGAESVRARLAAVRRYIERLPVLRAVLLGEAVALVFFEAAGPVEVPYVKSTLSGGNVGYGALVGAWGAGVVVGSLIFARSVRRPLSVMLSLGTLAVGLSYLSLSFVPSLAAACAAAVLGGTGQGIQWASLISSVQLLTPPALTARMMGAVESIGAIAPAIGLLLGGTLAVLTSPRWTLLILGLGATAMTAFFARLSIVAPASEDAEELEEEAVEAAVG
jgi:MFS family permease